jgi:hypothetical protein
MNRVNRKNSGILLVITLWFAMTVSVNGQMFQTGFFGGITVSQVKGDSFEGFNKLGWIAGFSVNRYIDYNIYWQAEIKYGTRGVYKGPSDIDQTLYRSSYHIIEIPLSVHYLYDEKILVEIGASPELLLAALYWDENGKMNPSTYPDNRRFGLNVFAGIGYWLNARMMAGLRYTNSAVPFRDPEEWNHPLYRGYFHNVISLSLNYRFKH